MKTRHLLLLGEAMLALACSHSLKDGEYTLTVLSTNDVHGSWFDSSYVDASVKKSLFAVNYYVDSVRVADGAGNVLLVDVGDCLQGDNAAYYFNYVDTLSPHLFPRLLQYMGYDACTVGNHDIETGHPVYDRVFAQMKEYGIPWLAGNAFKPDGSLWTVGIQDPSNPATHLGVINVGETAVVTSAAYQDHFTAMNGRTYHHILNPATGYPANNSLTSVTIICEDGTLADCLSTAMFVLGQSKAINYWRVYGGKDQPFEMILINNDNEVICTKGLIEAFTLSNNEYTLRYVE